MGEGESSAVGVRIQSLWELQTTDQAVPSPVGRETVRVRVVLFQLRLLSGTYFCTKPNAPQVEPAPVFATMNSSDCGTDACRLTGRTGLG
jgi:hypothetical protein